MFDIVNEHVTHVGCAVGANGKLKRRFGTGDHSKAPTACSPIVDFSRGVGDAGGRIINPGQLS